MDWRKSNAWEMWIEVSRKKVSIVVNKKIVVRSYCWNEKISPVSQVCSRWKSVCVEIFEIDLKFAPVWGSLSWRLYSRVIVDCNWSHVEAVCGTVDSEKKRCSNKPTGASGGFILTDTISDSEIWMNLEFVLQTLTQASVREYNLRSTLKVPRASLYPNFCLKLWIEQSQ